MVEKITKIEAQKRKGRFNVYVDGKYAFPISEEVFIKFRIFKGMEVDKDLIKQIEQADDLSKLHSRALNYLAHNLRTVYEVRTKLAEISDDPDAIDQVIAQLADQRLVDDGKYAESYVRTVVREEKNGPDWIRQHLKDKHVNSDDIEAALDRYFPADEVIRIGVGVAQKQLKSHHNDSAKMAINKTKNLLMRRGFPYSDLDQVMDQIDTDGMVEQDQELIDKVAEKYWRKYAKLDHYEQQQKTKQALFRKGFLMDDITSALERLSEG
ncbi:recombination regulator RecX [Lentilactobacillus kisonensis]|nr:recombination regulator RecX [Lentilactobacillus kisonensis]